MPVYFKGEIAGPFTTDQPILPENVEVELSSSRGGAFLLLEFEIDTTTRIEITNDNGNTWQALRGDVNNNNTFRVNRLQNRTHPVKKGDLINFRPKANCNFSRFRVYLQIVS